MWTKEIANWCKLEIWSTMTQALSTRTAQVYEKFHYSINTVQACVCVVREVCMCAESAQPRCAHACVCVRMCVSGRAGCGFDLPVYSTGTVELIFPRALLRGSCMHDLAVESGKVLIRSDGQVDQRSKAVRRGEVRIKEK